MTSNQSLFHASGNDLLATLDELMLNSDTFGNTNASKIRRVNGLCIALKDPLYGSGCHDPVTVLF